MVVIGTGLRFSLTFDELFRDVPGMKLQYSPFCGSCDAVEKEGTVATSHKKVSVFDYIGLATPDVGFDAWRFLASFPAGTLFIADGELMAALNQRSETASLYELDVSAHTCRKIS
jgi:hypothetical protein